MSCNCSDCTESITALTGETGAAGTSVAIATGSYSTSATSLEYVYTTNRASTASNALDYSWTIITIPAVSAANVAIFDAMFQLNAVSAYDLTVTVLGDGAPVAGISFVQNCSTRETVNVRFEIANVTQGLVYAIRLVSSDAGAVATLIGGNCRIDIYC